MSNDSGPKYLKCYKIKKARIHIWQTFLQKWGINEDIIRLINAKRHYILTKGAVQQEDITVINIYIPNDRAPKYM